VVKQLLLALVLSGATVLVHALGVVYVVLPLAGVWRTKAEAGKVATPVWGLSRLVCGLLVLHLVEMSLWAMAFAALSIFPSFETSLYFSLTSYTTVGYGDVAPPSAWRLVGPIEAAVGVLMLGLSTSFIVATLQRIHLSPHKPGSKEKP
jgi:hypothetical protein